MKRLLVVDDSSTIRQYCRHVFAGDGYVLGEAINGIDALEQVLEEPFDLYIVDVNMAKMNGYGLVRELRGRSIPQVPVLMMSTEATAEDERQAYAAGANLYLHKPVQGGYLKACVQILLGEASA